MHLTNTRRLLVFGLVCLVLTLLAPLAVSVFAEAAPVETAVVEGSIEADIEAAEAEEAEAEEAEAEEEPASMMYATIFSLLPPVVAIVLALITKEVYFSLFIGILSGALFAVAFLGYSEFFQINFWQCWQNIKFQ